MSGAVLDEQARPAGELDWAPVLAHLAWLRHDDPPIGRMVASEMNDDGSWTMPYEALSPESERLVDDLYAHGVVAGGIDWSRWLDGRGDDLVRDRDGSVIGEAGLEDCRRLLVALVRQSRFVEGALLDALRAGRVRWALERVAALTGHVEVAGGTTTDVGGTP